MVSYKLQNMFTDRHIERARTLSVLSGRAHVVRSETGDIVAAVGGVAMPYRILSAVLLSVMHGTEWDINALSLNDNHPPINILHDIVRQMHSTLFKREGVDGLVHMMREIEEEYKNA